MKIKSTLTNESIRGKFTSIFELVNYAISLAENMVRTGRAPRVHSEIDNPAVQVIDEIVAGKDRFEVVHEETTIAVFEDVQKLNGKASAASNEDEGKETAHPKKREHAKKH